MAALTLLVTGCEWFTTFQEQPKIEPWEQEFQSDSIAWLRGDTIAFRGNPQMSVPIYGTAMPGFLVSYAPLPGVVDSMSSLSNPVPADERSLAEGRKYYAINCAVCHGDGGAGDGPAVRYGVFPISIIGGVTQARTDGYIWGMIRNGRGAMPPYNRIEDRARWDVVNYVRGLQGRLPTQVERGPLAAPGVTGAAVPGASLTAPTRPAPFARDTAAAMGAAGDTTAGTSPAAGTATAPEPGTQP